MGGLDPWAVAAVVAAALVLGSAIYIVLRWRRAPAARRALAAVGAACFAAGVLAGAWVFHLAGERIGPTASTPVPPVAAPPPPASAPVPASVPASPAEAPSRPVQTVIYVANRDSVTTYSLGSNGNITPLTILSGPATGLSAPSAIAVDARGYIYVVNRGGWLGEKPGINVYPPGSNGEVVPIRTIAGPAADLHEPTGIALDGGGKMYITNGFIMEEGHYVPSEGDVAVYSAASNGNTGPVARITGRRYVTTFPHYWMYRPVGLALDHLGSLYVLNPGNEGIAKYRADSEGLVPPLSRIAGPTTALIRGTAINVNRRGDVFVADAEANAVMEFAGSATGDTAPIGTISGPATGISNPQGIALDANGDIFVANRIGYSNASVTEYAPGSNGNVAPIATISGPFTELADPTGIAIGPLQR